NGITICTYDKACPENHMTFGTCYDNHHIYGHTGFCPRDNICTQIKTKKIVFISTIVALTIGGSILIASLAWFVKDYFFTQSETDIRRREYIPINKPDFV